MVFRSGLSFTACWLGAHQAGIAPLFGKRENRVFLIGRGSFGAAAMSTYYITLQAIPLGDAGTLSLHDRPHGGVAAGRRRRRQPLAHPPFRTLSFQLRLHSTAARPGASADAHGGRSSHNACHLMCGMVLVPLAVQWRSSSSTRP